jgi:hypothetical protein
MKTLPLILQSLVALLVACPLAIGFASACQRPAPEPALQRIELSILEDKIRGGWAGQMIGVSYGASTEFQYLGRLVPEEKLVRWEPGLVANALNQDDLYVDITLAQVLDEHGLDATTEEFGAFFREAGYSLWHANLAARRALRRGVPASASGTPAHNAHANDIDFQIEADFVGLMTPGLPQASNDLCERAGRVMNSGDGLYGGMFVSAMYSAAFCESDPRRIVEAGLAALPPESPYAQVIADVLAWSVEHPDDWIRVWELIGETWDRREPCPEGALRPFNIDAKINGAYVALGLLYGNGDFAETIKIATRAGQDSDCNPASAAGVLGVVLGFEGIPIDYTSGIEAIADESFSYTDASFRTIVDSTLERAVAMVERHGGRKDGEALLIKLQEPEPAALEVWDDYGDPVERIPYGNPRWSWQGDWAEKVVHKWGSDHVSFASSKAGSEATIRFEGTGAILTGWFLPTGGLADVYLDGELSRTVDVYPDEKDVKFGEAIWHAFGLEDGEHEVRLVVRGEPYAESEGADVTVSDLTVFRH